LGKRSVEILGFESGFVVPGKIRKALSLGEAEIGDVPGIFPLPKNLGLGIAFVSTFQCAKA